MKKFWNAVASAAADPAMAHPGLTGSRLAWAAARVVGAQGAGINLVTDTRSQVSLGASDEQVVEAERWQFTSGEGPCLEASDFQSPVMAPLPRLSSRWPGFAANLQERTAYRSMYSLPLHMVGTLDLYYCDPRGCELLDVGVAGVVADQTALLLEFHQAFPGVLPWHPFGNAAASRRGNVWIAIGMLQEALSVCSADALDLLRARAFVNGTPIDDVAAHLVTGSIAVSGF